jgi:hypothetical protein
MCHNFRIKKPQITLAGVQAAVVRWGRLCVLFALSIAPAKHHKYNQKTCAIRSGAEITIKKSAQINELAERLKNKRLTINFSFTDRNIAIA